MKKQIYPVSISYQFDPSHRGAPYTFDGVHYMNGGEFTEAMVKAHMGFDARKDANTPYDMGSDIEEIRASVKSSKATLVNKKLGQNMEEVLDTYFQNVHSTSFIWGVVMDENLTVYTMNAKEFRPFIEAFANFDKSRQVVRFKATSGKMLNWLEAHI